ncbi:enterochelin esterase [Asaia lannensis]|uniref:enterochelin esterase n=1 Tax=Asaia lannensis TaxID=415421 RepID=UPI00223136CD|nr:enterochelin esterase [Asaia lannensis]
MMTHSPGTPEWWQELENRQAPLCEPTEPGFVDVTFYWREPKLNTASGSLAQVLVDINGVTDHHSETPQSLRPVPQTDIWSWSIRLPDTWCGTYSFIPLHKEDSFQAWLSNNTDNRTPDERVQAQRHWWVSIQDRAIADPLNPLRSYRSGWGGQCSPLILANAPRQPSWASVDTTRKDRLFEIERSLAIPESLVWQDHREKRRRAWLLQTQYSDSSESNVPLPLVVILDGATWIDRFPLRHVLSRETREGHLPPAFYVFVEQGNGEQRYDDLACNPAFWGAVQHNLLRQVFCLAPLSQKPEQRIIVGQSLGGLSALYAALCVSWSDTTRFGRVLSQSGSFWWPDSDVLHDDSERPAKGGWLCHHPISAATEKKVTVFLEVGNREGAMIDVNDAMADALRNAGHPIIQRSFSGGHDALCWRHGIIDGLRHLLQQPDNQALETSETEATPHV